MRYFDFSICFLVICFAVIFNDLQEGTVAMPQQQPQPVTDIFAKQHWDSVVSNNQFTQPNTNQPTNQPAAVLEPRTVLKNLGEGLFRGNQLAAIPPSSGQPQQAHHSEAWFELGQSLGTFMKSVMKVVRNHGR